MSDAGYSIAKRPPFAPEVMVRDPAILATTIKGRSLSRVLQEIPNAAARQAIAETTHPEAVDQILQANPFLGALSDSLIANTIEKVPLTPKKARLLGATIMAGTLETVAHHYGHFYDRGAFEADLDARIQHLERTEASEYREADRFKVMILMLQLLVDPFEHDLVVEEFEHQATHQLEAMSLKGAAKHAADLLQGLGQSEGEVAGERYNPYQRQDINAASQATAIAQVTTVLPFVQRVERLLRNEDPSSPELSPQALYAEGVRRTAAFLGRAIAHMAPS